MKRRSLTFFLLAIFLVWNVLTYFFIAYKPQGKARGESLLERRLDELQRQIADQADAHGRVLSDLKQYQAHIQQGLVERLQRADNNTAPVHPAIPGPAPVPVSPRAGPPPVGITLGPGPVALPGQQPAQEGDDPDKIVLAILVIACNRPTVSQSLDQLLKFRPSAEKFPIIVSQDCGHGPTADVIRAYGDQLTHIQHPDLSDIPLPKKDQKFKGYYKIARHYKWALNQIFHVMNYQAAIIVEDDLDLSPDFFEYFAATFPILRSDPTLWCVSAWNDNGKLDLVADEPELLYRTDFFPGLGWLLEKSVWLELENKWPNTFWDDWMRNPEQRQDRACIRPEISRTKTFGRIGVSRGQFYDKYLKYIKLNEVFVPFTEMDLSYLKKELYDERYVKEVYSAPLLTASQVQRGERPDVDAVRVEYNKSTFKTAAKALGLMDDVKSGVPRAGYRGVMSFMYNGRRVYLAPPTPWQGYDSSWS